MKNNAISICILIVSIAGVSLNAKTPASNLSQFWQLVDQGNSTNSYAWERIASSQDGMNQTAVVKAYSSDTPSTDVGGNIYLSHNFGQSWKPSAMNFNVAWSSVAMSSNGKYQAAVAEGDCIYVSDNFGESFVKKTNTVANWTSIAMSANGKYQTAVANSYDDTNNFITGIYRSEDYGKSWKTNTFSFNSWQGVSVSADGRIQTAVSFKIDGTMDLDGREGRIFNSYDYGRSWSPNTTIPVQHYTSSAMSADGRIQVVGDQNCNNAPADPGFIYISYDYGVHFTNVAAAAANWLFFSVSNDGRYMLGATYQQLDTNNTPVPNSGGIYYSTNYGNTWALTDAPYKTWTSLQLAADGKIASATAWGAGIYIKKRTP